MTCFIDYFYFIWNMTNKTITICDNIVWLTPTVFFFMKGFKKNKKQFKILNNNFEML